jgi:hypothetical protein
MRASPNRLMTDAEGRLLVSELQTQWEELVGQVSGLQSQINNIPLDTTPTQNPSGAVNQIRNGDYSHSVDSWYNDGAADNSRYECAWWYSHPIQDGQPMYKNTTKTGNATLVCGTVSTVTDTIRHSPHYFLTGMAVTFTGTAGVDLPAPIVVGTIYYIIVYDADRFQIAATYDDAIAGTFIPLTTTTTGGNVVFNYTLKDDTHTLYSESLSDWDWPSGAARFQGDTDVSAFFPATNQIQPGYSYFAVGSFVKLNQYIACQAEVRLFAGLYANSTALAGWDWVYGAFEISYEIVVPTGYTYVGGVAYTYQIHAVTNRDFTINSTVLNVADGPASADWTAGCRVILTWKRILNFGVNSYNIYRTGGTNVRLFNVVNGTTYIDNNSFQETGTIPAADYTKLIAYTSTNADIVNTLPYQGDPLNPNWSPIPFSLKVPQNFDLGDVVLEDGVWLRFGFLGAPDRLDLDLPDGVIVNGDTALTSAVGQFTADQVGCDIDIYLANDIIFATRINAYVSPTEVTMLDPAPDDDTDCRIYIHEGAPYHCISIDLAHVGFVPGATFAYNPEDMSPDRGIPPVTPNGTSQGGNPGGQPPNTPDGHPVCLWIDEEVTLFDGTKIPIGQLNLGDKLANGYDGYNIVTEIRDGVSDVWLLVTENRAEVLASPTKQVYIAKGVKKVLSKIAKGDIVLTSLGESKVLMNQVAMKKQIVRQISLTPTDTFLAGSKEVQIVVSNNKPIEPIIVPV